MASSEVLLPAFLRLIATPEPPTLGPQSRPNTLPLPELNRQLDTFFAARSIRPGLQPQLRSAALLWHDHLEQSHAISQEIDSPDGSWLHGIMHRREPDFGNAKYWFRRVGHHDAFATLAAQVAALLQDDTSGLAGRLVDQGQWLPFAFVDECQRAQNAGPALDRLLRQVQALEFNVLLGHILAR